MLKKLSAYALALIGLTAFFASSCKKEYEPINQVDSTKILTYIQQNKLTGMIPDSAKSGYYYQIINPGTGKTFVNTDSVLYNYSIKGMDNGITYMGEKANSNYGSFVGYTYDIQYHTTTLAPNSKSILGVRDVMNKLKPGGSARILIPSFLAYGNNGLGDIPGNENLDLTITAYPETSQYVHDDNVIKAYIAAKGLTMIKDSSRVYYQIITPGSGTYAITDNSTLSCTYTGRLRDGSIFDSSLDTTAPASITLGSNAIEGWTKVLPGKVQKGGTIRIIIPSDLAYGKAGSSTGAIAPNTILDFTITILAVLQ